MSLPYIPPSELVIPKSTQVMRFNTANSSGLETVSKMIVSEDAEDDDIVWYSIVRYRLDDHPDLDGNGFLAGDEISIYCEVHGTNDDARSEGVGVAWVTEFRLKDNQSNDRLDGTFNVPMHHDSGHFNVGVEAHHGLISREGAYTFTDDYSGELYFCLMSHVKTTNVPNDTSPDFDLTQDRTHLQGAIYRQN